MNREIILDTETTGLHPNNGHRIIEIGAIEMQDRVLTGEKFHYYINPERDVPKEAYEIHGISTEFLKDKPLFKDISTEFLDFIKEAKLVIHNAPFDIRFLNSELTMVGLPSLEVSESIDTLVIARKKYPGARVRLDDLCKRFKIDNSNRTLHGALKDADLLAEVYVELMGGRQTSFKISKDKEDIFTTISMTEKKVRGNKLIIFPTSEELDEHQQLMKKIIK